MHTTFSPVDVVMDDMSFTTVPTFISGWPAQFLEMYENSLCSTLFHFDVPGGRCDTSISRPVSSASLASSYFHSLSRLPLIPKK